MNYELTQADKTLFFSVENGTIINTSENPNNRQHWLVGNSIEWAINYYKNCKLTTINKIQ